MLPHHAISDADWGRVEHLFPARRPAADNRLFVDAVPYDARAGIPWRNLPERFGNWNSARRRFDRRARAGVWRRVSDALQDPGAERLLMDSTAIRADPAAPGANKTPTGPGAGRTRPSAAAGAGSGPRPTPPSAGSGRRPGSS
jgi:transposase